MDTIGIDPGCSVTGWAVFRNRVLFKYGAIRAKAGLSLQEKILFITETLQSVIEEFEIKNAAIEDSYVNMINPYSSLKLASLRGGLIVLLQRNDIKIHMYTPTQIKKLIVQHGHASKEDIRLKVLELTSVAVKSKDINDAIATCLCLLKEL